MSEKAPDVYEKAMLARLSKLEQLQKLREGWRMDFDMMNAAYLTQQEIAFLRKSHERDMAILKACIDAVVKTNKGHGDE